MKLIVFRQWMDGDGDDRLAPILAAFDVAALKRARRAPGRARSHPPRPRGSSRQAVAAGRGRATPRVPGRHRSEA